MEEDFEYVVSTEPDEEPGAPPPFDYDDQSPNLAVDFDTHIDGRVAMKKIAMQVKDDFDAAFEGSKSYRERVKDDHALFSGDLPPKEYPFKNAANAHIPTVLENLNRISTRAESELLGDWSNVFGVVPMGPEDEETANIITKHGNWQIRNQITDFRRQMARALLLFFGPGDVTCYSSFDPVKKCNRHEVLTCDEFVTPHTMVSTEPDYSDLPFYCRIMHYYRHEVQGMRDIWYQVDKVLERQATTGDEPEAVLADSQARIQGIEDTDTKGRAPYKLIHFEGWLSDLPNQQDDRFCKVIMDYATKHILHLSIHEEDEWQDKIRHERELSDLQGYRQEKAIYDEITSAMVAQEQEAADVRNAVSSGPFDRAEAGANIKMLREQPLPEPPIAPQWMDDPDDPEAAPEPARKAPIRMFAHGVCIEPLTGVLGFGYSRILGDLNRAGNVTLSQFVDAASLANGGVILSTADFEIEGGFKVRPGSHMKVQGASGQDLREKFIQLQFPPANSQLLEVAKWTTALGQSAVQAPDVLSGESGKSGETFRGISSRIDQATKQLQVPTRRFANFLEQVLKNNAKLNATFLPDEEIVNITDEQTRMASPIRVSRAMYDREYRVEFRSDLRFTSQAQRIQEADEVVALVMSNPATAMNMALVYAVTKKSLEARGRQDLIPLLGPPPPPPTTPMAMPPPPQEGPV